MEYQISYLSPLGHIKKLADAFAKELPTEPVFCDLELETFCAARVHLVGFELTMNDTIPAKAMDFLGSLGGMTVFVFATTPFVPNDAIWQQVFRRIIPFVPDHCDFCGFHICPAQPMLSMLEGLQCRLTEEPSNGNVRQWLEQCEHAVGRPNEEDIMRSCDFMRHVLKLEKM